MLPGTSIVFLDRDGTLIDTDVRDGKPFAVGDPERLTLVDGVVDSCTQLKAAGFRLVLVTNQPDVARGSVERSVVEGMNARLVDLLGLDLAITCYHDDADGCSCRKPLPGMLIEGAAALDVTLDESSYIIGDRWKDIDAGAAAGVTTVFIDRGYHERLRATADFTVAAFPHAVRWIVDRSGKRSAHDSRG